MSERCRSWLVSYSVVCLLPLFECKIVVYLSILTVLLILTDCSDLDLFLLFLLPCWSTPNKLFAVFVKGTKASFVLHSHPHPSLGAGMEAGQQYGGTDGGSEKAGLEGRSQTLWAALSFWDSLLCLLSGQHPLFFIHHPLCPPPAVLLNNRLWVEDLMLTYSCKYLIRTFLSLIFYIRQNLVYCSVKTKAEFS